MAKLVYGLSQSLDSVLVRRDAGAQAIIFLFSRISLNYRKMRSSRRAFGRLP